MDVVLVGVLVDERVDLRRVGKRVVDLDERVPLVGQRVLGKDRLDRALGFARPAVDAFLRIDDEDPLEHVDAVDRADVHARQVFDVDARLGDDVRHARESSETIRRLIAFRRHADELVDELAGHAPRAPTSRSPGRSRRRARAAARPVRVIREADDRDLGPGVDDLLGLDRAMSAMTRSGGWTLSVVTSRCPASSPRASLGRTDRPRPAGSSPRRDTSTLRGR